MARYLVTMSQTVEVEAVDIDEAEMMASEMLDWSEAYFETEEGDDNA